MNELGAPTEFLEELRSNTHKADKELTERFRKDIQQSVIADIIGERLRQDRLCEIPENRKNGWRKFCESDSTDRYKLAILLEEVGEVGTAVLKEDEANLCDELIQVAAVAVAWAEALREKDAKEYPDG